MIERKDDFQQRREHLKNMTDQELKIYFFELANKMIDPLIDLAYHNTSKSIERSILLRMGFSSIEAKGIVDILSDENLLSLGAGHAVYVLYKEKNIPLKEAGLLLQQKEGIEFVKEYFNHE
jgi:D-ornithine 4,5-aminomutase subunit alpha